MTGFVSKQVLRCLAAGAFMSAALGIGSASAVPINWHLQGVTFDDGGTASGSFTFDAAGGGYSNVNIVTTSGAVRSGDSYIAVCGTDVPSCNGLSPSNFSVLFLSSVATDQTGAPAFALNFGAPLTDLGGMIPIEFSIEASCDSPSCSAPDDNLPGRLASGFVTTAVPEPVSGGILLSGLGAMFALRRRRGAPKKP